MPSRVHSIALAFFYLFYSIGCGPSNPAQTPSGKTELLPVKSVVAKPLKELEKNGPIPTSEKSQTTLPDGAELPNDAIEDRALSFFKAVFESRDNLSPLFSPELKSSNLVPTEVQLEEVRMAGGFIVRRLRKDALFPADSDLQSITAAKVAFANPDQFKIKDLGNEMLMEWHQGNRTVIMQWSCRWENEPQQLSELRLIAYQEVIREGKAFEEATQNALGSVPHYREQLLRGADHWAQRLTRIDDMRMTGHSGIAVGDVNGDGLDDLYVCDEGGLPNRLYVQNPDGTVRDVSAASGTDWLEGSRGALLLDLDNDGDQDLVVSTVALILFAENDGDGKFKLRGGHPGSPSAYSLAASDFDLDGDVDLYVCTYGGGIGSGGTSGFEAKSPVPFNDAENGGRNLLLKNNGGFAFEDVTDAVGLGQRNTRWSFAAAWEDADGDGDSDLYVANDFGRNCFYRNNEGIFEETAEALGIEDMASGMSVAWGDFNRDARMDLYVGNMFSSAGKRAGVRKMFSKDVGRMAGGNTLYAGQETGFSDVSTAAGVTMGRWAWSSGFADLNNDGWEDLVIANGYLTNRKADDL